MGFGDFHIAAQVIHTVKHTDDLVLLVQEETVLQCIIHKLAETRRNECAKKRTSRQSTPMQIMIERTQLEILR